MRPRSLLSPAAGCLLAAADGMFFVLHATGGGLCDMAVIAQLVARRSHNPKVVSSILTHRIVF